MKTSRFAPFLAAALVCAAFPFEVRATAEKPAAEPPPTATPGVVVTTWSDIQDVVYDSRADFFAGLKQLETIVDAQVAELTARRAAMKSTTDTKEWDFTMKEMNNARAYLLGMDNEAGKATVETWAQQKEKVGQAWDRIQEAYAKVKSTAVS